MDLHFGAVHLGLSGFNWAFLNSCVIIQFISTRNSRTVLISMIFERCDVHSAMDVLLSTASIMNLCLISLDRYWSITQAVEYLKKRTPIRAIVMITAVWLLSAVICIPPLLGWKVERTADEQYPKCQLSEELGYVLYSALGSFYIPSCIMVFVYIRIYYAAKARARRGIRKPPRRQPQDADTCFSNTPGMAKNGNGGDTPAGGSMVDRNSNTSPRDGERQIATIEAHPKPIAIPTVTCDLASDISTSDNAENAGMDVPEQKDTLKVFSAGVPQVMRNPLAQCQFRGSTLSVNGELQQQAAAFARTRQPSMGIDTDMVSEFDPSSSDSGVVAQCTAVKPLKLRLCKPIFGRSKNAKNRNRTEEKASQKVSSPSEKVAVEHVVPRVQKPRDPEREKRRIARKKEKRATLILGLIMGSFIACWLPFFFMYILRLAYVIPGFAFSTAFWLGYMNSALNPVIYTIFNKDFRRAFRRILFK